MTRSTFQRVTTADRDRIFRYLRHHKIEYTRHDTNAMLAVALARHLGRRFRRGGYEEKVRFLHRFCADQSAVEAKQIVPPMTPRKFQPLRQSAEMLASLERTRELYPPNRDHLSA